jgi:hypothetical protein
MTHAEAEASIWPELIAKWNLRHNWRRVPKDQPLALLTL